MQGDKSQVIPNAEGNRTTPSIVYIKGEELLVGELAKRKAVLEPKNVVYEVKRFIGKQYKEVKSEAENMPYDTKEGKDGGVLIVVDGKEYKPEQISAFILKKLKEDADKFLDQTVSQAVITVPAYFNDSQRNATKAAGEIANLKVERIINEPTAAALAYGEGQNKDEKICVFDLGGGTHDVTMLEIGAEGTFQVLATSGDTSLGGANFDELIIEHIVSEFKKKESIDLRDNAMAMQRVKDEAEKAKKQLSQTERVDITIPFITTGEDGQPRNLDMVLTRPQFESMSKSLIQATKKPVEQALSDSGLSKNDVNEIILVGGSTRMPWVKGLIKDIFGKEPKSTVNPDESVAQGAAIQAGIIQ
jgi:molecular chaperone DnaK